MSDIKINKSRIEYIDLAKGFCIFLVLIRHAAQSTNFLSFDEYDFFQASRIPLYFCLSGLFFKPYEGFVGFLKRKINKLLIPFLFFYIVFACGLPYISCKLGLGLYGDFQCGINVFSNVLIDPYIWFNGPIWFLLCLFWMNIICYPIVTFFEHKENGIWLIVLISIILSIFGYILFFIVENNICYFGTAFTALPFFVLGYCLRKYTTILSNDNRFSLKNLSIALIAFLIMYYTRGKVSYLENSYKIPLLQCYLCGVSGTISVLFVSKFLHSLPVFSYIGRYSIIVLSTHMVVLYFITPYINLLVEDKMIQFCCAILFTTIICALLIPVFKKLLPWVVAQKDVIPINK